MNSNVVITFDGLMLFRFSPKKDQKGPDCRNQCKIGIVHETGNDPHRLTITVYQVSNDGETTLAEAKDVEMTENPRIFDQNALRCLSSFHLFLGQDATQLPESGRVIRDPSFNEVLQIDGTGFYDSPVDILWNKLTPFYATVGLFSGVNSTAESEFCRVSKDVLPAITNTLSMPGNWQSLSNPDKISLKSFSRKMRAEIEICQNESLIANAKSNTGAVETIFKLKRPKDEFKRYVLEINNLDEAEEKASPEFIVSNCANFTYLCEAVDIPQLTCKPIYGLTYNFDFTIETNDDLGDDTERCDSACCIGCEAGVDPQGPT